MTKIVVLDASTVTGNDLKLDTFNQYGELTIYDYSNYEDVADRIKDADIVLCNKSAMDEHNLKTAVNLRYIGLFATGYNNVDLEYTNKKEITVCNAGGYSTEAVTQHVFALILNYYNKISEYDKYVKEGNWIQSKYFSPFMPMNELSGKTIGIIGYGSIGRKVAEVAKVFGMKVIAYNRSEKHDEDVRFIEIDELLATADIVTMHCPLNKESDKICNQEFFGRMKKKAYFVNTSRGSVVDEQALFNALENEVIAGAAIDVIETEPMKADCILKDAKNIIITPHAAWAPIETRGRLIEMVEENLRAFIQGSPVNVVRR